MRRNSEIIQPQKRIRVPLQFLKKMDKLTIHELQHQETLSKQELAHRRSALSPELRPSHPPNAPPRIDKQYASLPREGSGSKEAPRIKFRTTGAGFRQRKHQVEEKPEKKPRIFKVSPFKPSRERLQTPEKHKYEDFVFKERLPSEQKQAKPKKAFVPKRIYFGEDYAFRESGEYEYSQVLKEEDFEWQDEMSSYKKVGFGVDCNLSRFDLQSLEDPQGLRFKEQYQGHQGLCPIFNNGHYEWVKVRVVGFKASRNEVIVERLGSGEVRSVSRLSIRFESEWGSGEYWKRIHEAKKLRRQIKEEEKYERYLSLRKENFSMSVIAHLQFDSHFHSAIEKDWFNPYSRQFLLYKEMSLRPDKFTSMGIKVREFKPFTQPPTIPPFPTFAYNRDQVANKHYSRFQKFAQTLYKLFEKLSEEACVCIDTNIRAMSAQELKERMVRGVKEVCDGVRGKRRELLLSEVLGELAFAFKSKLQERRYIKVHNLIFSDLIISHLYELNSRRWTNYLSSFLSPAQAPPPPLLTLHLTLNKNREIQIQPSLEQVKAALAAPLLYLESSVQTIPDIMCELLGGEQVCLRVKRSLLSQGMKRVGEVSEHSFVAVDTFCGKFRGKLKYLEKVARKREAFTAEGKDAYQCWLREAMQDLTEINHSVLYRSGILEVDCSQLKEAMREGILKYKNRVGKVIEKQVEEEVEGMGGRFRQEQEQLLRVPSHQQQLVRMREYLSNHCQLFLDQAIRHYELCQQFYCLLEDYSIELSFPQYEKTTEAIMQQNAFMGAVNAKLNDLNTLEQEMIEAINNERDQMLRELQEVGPQIELISNYSTLAQITECYVFTSKTYHSLEHYQRQLLNINYREKVLAQEVSIVPLLYKLERDLRPYFDLWNNAYQLNSLISHIKSEPIHALKYEALSQQTTDLAKELQRLSTFFVSIKNAAALTIVQGLLQKVAFLQDKLWIVRCFTLEGVLKKEGIRKEILSKVLTDQDAKFTDLTLDTLLQEKVEAHKDFVVQNCEKAERIWKLQLKIAGIVNEVKKLQFQFSKQLQVPFVEEKVLLSLSCAVHEQVEVMQSVRDTKEAAFIQKKINTVYNKLTIIEDTLLQMVHFQETFFPLFRLLAIDDLSKDMGRDLSTFLEVERIWKAMCHQFKKDQQVWEAIETDSHKNRLENLSKMMAQVDKKLKDVIDKKRQSFPRLFFIPHAKVRYLLLNPEAVTQSLYMPMLFTGIKDLVVRSDRVRGVRGWDGQEILFKKNSAKTILWEYMKFVEEEVGKIIQWQLNFKSNKAQKFVFSKSTRILCQWTSLIEQALATRDLQGLLANLHKQLSECMSNTYENCIYKSYYIMMRDKAALLHKKNVNELSSFEWKKEVKFYPTEGGGVEMRTINLSLPFKEQYTGNHIRPIFNLTDRMTVQLICLSYQMNTGLVIEGRGSEGIREICGVTMRHYVQHSIGQQTSQQDILYLLRGYFCSETWVCLKASEPILKEIFEMIAQAAYEVHSVIEAGRTLFYLGGQPYNTTRAFHFNLFIGLPLYPNAPKFTNFETNCLEGINTKFGVVFRSVSWLLPPESMICRLKLECLGVAQAETREIMKAYEFAVLVGKGEWFFESFTSIIDSISQSIIAHPHKAYELFLNYWSNNLSKEQAEQFSALTKKPVEPRGLKAIIQEMQCGKKRRLLLMGKHLSGKQYTLRQVFAQLGLQLREQLQYAEGELQKWQYISVDFYSKLIPLQQKLIVKAYTAAHLHHSDVDTFLVYNHKEVLHWKAIVSSLNYTNIHPTIKKEAQRQLQVLLSLPALAGISNPMVQNTFSLSFFKFISIFCQSNKIEAVTPLQNVELVFMLLYWQALTFLPSLKLAPNTFGSTLAREPISYYYDLQKSAWLEWTTLNTSYFVKDTMSMTEIFLPTKETASFIYFFTNITSKCNIWVQAEDSGIGLHRTIQRSIRKGLLEFYKAHEESNCEGISQLVTHSIAIFKKGGKYYPRLNESLIVCVEDVNLPNTAKFNSFMDTLLNHAFEKEKKRLLANCTFICTVSEGKKDSVLLVAASKKIVCLKALTPSHQSARMIFSYYLEWFFGNTDNPFSKEVRKASQLIVELSAFILDHSKCAKFSQIVKVFLGVCQCSPKTVKTTHDILQLWLYQCRSIFQDQHYLVGVNTVTEAIQKFIEISTCEKDVLKVFRECLEGNSIFLKLPSLKVDYSQTYRKLDGEYLYGQISKRIQAIDHRLFSYFPLIIFQHLLHYITRIIRVFNIPQRHLLIYGGRNAGKCTLARIASFVYCGTDAHVIANIQGWKQILGKSLKSIGTKESAQAIAFRLRAEEEQEFMSIIEQILFLSHPRSLIFDRDAHYLESLQISSPSSDPYLELKQRINSLLHCCLSFPSARLTHLTRYPYLLRKVQLINIHSNYMRDGPKQIAEASVGKYYSGHGVLDEINSTLIEEGIEMNQGKLMKLIQIALHNYRRCLRHATDQQNKLQAAIGKIRVTEKQKQDLEKELLKTNKHLEKLMVKVQELRLDYKSFEEQYQDKVNDYNNHHQDCQMDRERTGKIRQEVDFELSKVLPMLKEAEEAMAKVTRDDINQLRSFPSPPLPAAKVVESLIFLFNESHLVKEKVLDGGQKVRDFWEYAKKFILNDKLLKRVEQFKPEVIKNIEKGVIATLKEIIKKPEFAQERVFKASVAAGNLSLWIRAILAVYDVMLVIEPKKKVLNEAEQALAIREFHLKNEREQLDRFHSTLMEKKKYYDSRVEEKDKVVGRIKQLEHYIEKGQEILAMLYLREQEWMQMKQKQLPQMLQVSQEQSIFAAVYFSYLTILPPQQKLRIITTLQERFTHKGIFSGKKYSFVCFREYQQRLFSFVGEGEMILPLVDNFYESALWVHELMLMEQKAIFVLDHSYLFLPYLLNQATTKLYSYHPKVIDCLQIKSVDDVFEENSRNPYQAEEQDGGRSEVKVGEVLIIVNMQHRPEFLLRLRQVIMKLAQFQLLFVFTQESKELTSILQKERYQINCIIQSSPQISTYILKHTFALPIPSKQELQYTITHARLKDKLTHLLTSTDNIVTNEQAFEEWVSTHHQEKSFTSTNRTIKKAGKMQEESIGEIVQMIEAKRVVNTPKMMQFIGEYLQQGEEGADKGLIGLCEWLKSKLLGWPESLIKIISTDYESTNALGYYLLLFKKMEELQKSRSKEQSSKPKDADGRILSVPCEIIDPASLLHSLKNNLHSYICLTDKYRLKKALAECKQIEEMYKTEYLEQFLEREEQHYIYIISECGAFYVEELVELRHQQLKSAITHDWDGSTPFKEAYHLERLLRRYDSLSNKQKQYVRLLFNRPLIQVPSVCHLYSVISEEKNELHGGSIVGVKQCWEGKGKMLWGGKEYVYDVRAGRQVECWELQQILFALHASKG